MSKSEAARFILRKDISQEDIIYVIRQENKTFIKTKNGESFQTYIPVKDFKDALNEKIFLDINKGTLVNKNLIVTIDKNEYHMIDGQVLYGRIRTPMEHQINKEKYTHSLTKADDGFGDINAYAIIESMPFACFILQVKKEKDNDIKLIIKYFNKKMEDAVGIPFEEAKDKEWTSTIPHSKEEWQIAYLNTAINGVPQNINGYCPCLKTDIVLQCWRPKKDFIICIFKKENSDIIRNHKINIL